MHKLLLAGDVQMKFVDAYFPFTVSTSLHERGSRVYLAQSLLCAGSGCEGQHCKGIWSVFLGPGNDLPFRSDLLWSPCVVLTEAAVVFMQPEPS